MSWSPGDRLAFLLVALVGINIGVLDQVGQGLVADVEDKYEELGADWIVLRYSYRPDAAPIDIDALRADIERIPGVNDVMMQFGSSQFLGEAEQSGPGFLRITSTDFLVLTDEVDLVAHPYLYTLFEDQTEGTAFYRNEILWLEGGPPLAPLEAALPVAFAESRGLRTGDTFGVPWNRPMTFGGAPQGPDDYTFRVSGIYQPILTGNMGEDIQRILVRPDASLLENVTVASPSGMTGRLHLLLRADLDRLSATVDRLYDIAAAHDLELGTSGTIPGVRTRIGTLGVSRATNETAGPTASPSHDTGPDDPAPPEPDPTPTPTNQTAGPGGSRPSVQFGPAAGVDLPDIELFANEGLIAQAFDAAHRAGGWFRFLATGSVVLAAVGIGAVVRAEARRLARRIGVLQAVGFTTQRLVLAWAARAALVAGAGALAALLVVVAGPVTGADAWLFGIEMETTRNTLLLVPALAVGLFLAAGLPHIVALVRRPPAVNLREAEAR